MNTNALKKFAQEARRKLLEQVGAKLEYVLHTDTPELREKADQVQKLREAIQNTSREQVIDKVTYTWFNRFMALRFMDANDYQPIGVRVLTPKDGYTLPALLDEAKQGNIPEELAVKHQKIYDLLDGKIPSANAQNEAYRYLLIAACNHLNKVFPFLFERINDYTELLLPDDLTSELSIIQDIRDGMNIADCAEVEIIGWLYQFYISEKKDEVFASKSSVKKEDIPAATQLFTPRWIVEYMVQNTVGKLWLQNKPNSRLRDHMPYFIESPSVTNDDYLKLNSIEELTLLDQACGSGHILVYGFDLLYKIYEEEGYSPNEIPALIIKNNLFGFEIDERASQLAGMALMMKARSYNRRFFKKEVKPNILCYQDITFTIEEKYDNLPFLNLHQIEFYKDLEFLEQATNYGSLIIPKSSQEYLENGLKEIEKNYHQVDVFRNEVLERLKIAVNQLLPLSKKYHCIVDNPPYMGGGNMNKVLGDYVKKDYPDSKADLMACFMEAGINMLQPKGFLGMINQHSWMFLSSYEKLREKLVTNVFFDTNLHLGARTFPEIGGEVVQNTSFTLWNHEIENKGVYFRLVDFNTTEVKRDSFLEAIHNPKCGWFYKANQKYFEKIPGSPIAYWVGAKYMNTFETNQFVLNNLDVKQGLATGNNDEFLRMWFEVNNNNIGFGYDSTNQALNSNLSWFPYNKGGGYKKWYGNQFHVIRFNKSSFDKLSKQGNNLPSRNFYFKESITWSDVSTGSFACRYSPKGFVFDVKGSSGFSDNIYYDIGLLNSIFSISTLFILNPTMSYQVGNIKSIPYRKDNSYFKIIEEISKSSIQQSKEDWDSKENNWDFKQNELIRIKAHELEETYIVFQQYWKNKFFQLHKNEEELNRHFIEIYGLEDELTPDVPLEDITILKEETVIEHGQLVYKEAEVFAQFMSYAVGCMFGRYSLDQVGLILANEGDTLQEYLEMVGKTKEDLTFTPDEDNIIPVLDDEWFEDDITARFYDFLKASFGEANFNKNLAFVEKCLGMDVRKYFVKGFYADHIKRYKKRPIYWMFSSPKGSFNVLIYLHRYTPDTINNILNGYLREFIQKLKSTKQHYQQVQISGSTAEQNKAIKQIDRLDKMISDCEAYEREILFPLATERISIDLDDGVLVNYNKMGKAVMEVAGLNDKATKKKVREFDWINVAEIRG
jgi:type II restriction/modification system DNA methylase subunit YeeA